MESFSDIELRHLRYFRAVAEELHFRRAAARLHLSQPSLSHAIGQFEERLGCELVDRSDRRRIRLTNAGETMLAHVRELEDQLAFALRDVRAIAAAEVGILRIGYNDGEPVAQNPSRLRGALRGAAITVSFRRLPWGEEASALRRGDVDVLLARLPIDETGLRKQVLFEEPLMLCVATTHPISSRRRVRASELRKLPMVIPQGGDDTWRRFWRGIPDDGDTNAGPVVRSPEETFDVVSAGAGACLVPASMVVEGAADAVCFLPVTGLPASQLALLWRGRQTRPVRQLIDALSSLFESQD